MSRETANADRPFWVEAYYDPWNPEPNEETLTVPDVLLVALEVETAHERDILLQALSTHPLVQHVASGENPEVDPEVIERQGQELRARIEQLGESRSPLELISGSENG
jgi:hypothetical protein